MRLLLICCKTFCLIRVEVLWKRMTLSPTSNYSNCTFPRLTLHACTLTRTNSLSYRGISLRFYLVTEVFQLVTRYFTFPVRFQLNSDFSHTFLNGQLTRCAINTCIHEHVVLESKAQMSHIKGSYLFYVLTRIFRKSCYDIILACH